MPKKGQFSPKLDKSKGRYYFRFGGKKHDLGRDYWGALRRIADIAGDKIRGPAAHTVAAAITAYLPTHRRPDWAGGLLKSFEEFSQTTELRDLPEDHLIRFAASLSNSPATIRHKVRLANAVLKHAIKQGWMDRLPDAPKLEVPQTRARDIPPDVLTETWQKLPDRAKPLLEFMLTTGCRPSEAMQLKWSEIDWSRAVIVKDDHKLKHRGKKRVIYMADRAVELLRSVTRCKASEYVFLSRLHKPYSREGLLSILREASKRKPYDAKERPRITSIYSLRHTFAQRALDNGVGIEDLAGLLGHTQISTTQVYAQVREDRLRAVAKKLG